MPDIDLSTAALERLLALDAKRTPGEWGLDEWGWSAEADYWDNQRCVAAAVNHLAPLAREVLRLREQVGQLQDLDVQTSWACSQLTQERDRLRAAVEQHVGKCDRCHGQGDVSRWNETGDPNSRKPCHACAGLRAALRKDG